ncbi:hypothetical protein F5888DRAFT_1743333 [Russula emetica]|nr:hypothetical protein F5888DRAFT_1743333 [Russula emetica]
MGTLLIPLICIHEAPPSRSKVLSIRRPWSAFIRSGGLSLMRVPVRTSICGLIWAPFTPIQTSILRCQLCLRGAKCYHYLERDLKPGEGAEPEQHDAAQHPAHLKPPDHVAEDSDKAGGAWWERTPLILGCPQLTFAVEMGDVKTPNPCMVEAKRKAKWPPRGQATEQKHRPDRPPREVLYKCDPNVLKRTGTCKPEDELAILKSAAPGHLEVRTWYIEGEPSWEGLIDPQGPHFEATEPRSRASSPAERKDALFISVSIALGHSCSAYPRLF